MAKHLSFPKFISFFILIFILMPLFLIFPAKTKALDCILTLNAQVNDARIDLTWNVANYTLGADEQYLISIEGAPSGVATTKTSYYFDKPDTKTEIQAEIWNTSNKKKFCQSNKLTFTPPHQISDSDVIGVPPPDQAAPAAETKTDQSTNEAIDTMPQTSVIRNALTPGNTGTAWVIDAWKVVLGLANMGLVLILVFLAAINVLHIQYDTYAIKKVLPVLIIGILLADFSLLIIRMLLDASNILTLLFTEGKTPAEFAHDLIAQAQTTVGQTSGLKTTGELLIWFLFSILVFAAFLILGFLFYIRYIVIIVCAIAAPLAFISLAFPPTQSFFKQWWGWLTKYIFMKPIVFFFLYLALKIRGSTEAMNSITGWAIIAAMIIIAIIIPFKLGGAVMAGWGKAGQWLTGTKAGGYIRKPIDNFIQGKKDAWKERANLGAEKYLKFAGYDLANKRQKHALTLERLKAERGRVGEEAQVKIRAKLGQRLGMEKAKQARAKTDIEDIEKINDILDRKQRGVERTQNELRDRIITAAHNGITKKQMHDMFEGGEGPPPTTDTIWMPVMTSAIAGEKGEKIKTYIGHPYADVLGEVEGFSGEMDRGIEKVNSDAMLRVAERKLGVYYKQMMKTVITVRGKQATVEESFHSVLDRLKMFDQERNDMEARGINKGEDYEDVVNRIQDEQRRGTEVIEEAKRIKVKDASGKEQALLDDKGVEMFEAAFRQRRAKAPTNQGGQTGGQEA